MRARKLLSARNCNCFTAPSVLRISRATSLMLFCSTNRSTTTRFCSAGNVSTRRNNVARRSTSSNLCRSPAPIRSAAHPPPLPARALPAVRDQIRCNPEQPRRKRNPTPLKPFQVGQRMMKYLGGHILGFRSISHPPHHVRIHPLEIVLIKLRKAGRILLRRFDQKPLVRFSFSSEPSTNSPRGVVLHRDNGGRQQKVTREILLRDARGSHLCKFFRTIQDWHSRV